MTARCFLRRFDGPAATELFLLCRPSGGDATAQAAACYRSMAETVAAAGGSLENLVSETVYFRNLDADLPRLQSARRTAATHRITFVEQPPLDASACFEVAARAILPCRGAAPRREIDLKMVHGEGDDPFAEARALFDEAARRLAASGMSFRHVVRTWIYFRDIDADYESFNRARRAFFRRAGVDPFPASTGVGGRTPGGHAFAMDLVALAHAEVARLSPTTQNEASDYGSDFSRGLRLFDGRKTALYLSGTASIDAEGHTAHPRDITGQADRMLANLAALLDSAGASFADALSAVTYVKDPADGPRLLAALAARGLAALPNAIVCADLCRADLLCEMELLASPRRVG